VTTLAKELHRTLVRSEGGDQAAITLES
jgi:hypothetical protein